MNAFEYAVARAFRQREEQAKAGRLSEKEQENLEVLKEAVAEYARREGAQQ